MSVSPLEPVRRHGVKGVDFVYSKGRQSSRDSVKGSTVKHSTVLFKLYNINYIKVRNFLKTGVYFLARLENTPEEYIRNFQPS